MIGWVCNAIGCCIRPFNELMANMQIRTLTQGLGIYRAKTSVYEYPGLIVNPG